MRIQQRRTRRQWYLAQGPDEHWHRLAKSKDGRIWEKPDLGLVEWHGCSEGCFGRGGCNCV